MVNPLLARLREHVEATQRGEVAGRSILGAGANPVSSALNTLGLIQDAFEAGKKPASGVGVAALQANPIVRAFPNSPGARASRAALAALRQGEGNPLERASAANEAAASGNELAMALINESMNPLNYTGVAGRAGQALRLSGKAPALAKLLTGTALAGEGVNRASVLPLALIPGARRALLSAPDWLDDAARLGPVARKAAPSVANALESAARQLEAKGKFVASSNPLRTKLGGVAQNQLEKIGGKRQYGPGEPAIPPAMHAALFDNPPAMHPALFDNPPPFDPDKLPPVLPRGPLPPAYDPASIPPPLPRGPLPPALTPEVFNPLRRVATPLDPLRDDTELVADRTFRAKADLGTAIEAAYGEKVEFALPRLLKKLGATQDRFGRVVRDGRDITENVLMYLDDHTRIGGTKRKAINARYGALADEVTPPPDATDAQLDELIGETAPAPMLNVDIPAKQPWQMTAAEYNAGTLLHGTDAEFDRFNIPEGGAAYFSDPASSIPGKKSQAEYYGKRLVRVRVGEGKAFNPDTDPAARALAQTIDKGFDPENGRGLIHYDLAPEIIAAARPLGYTRFRFYEPAVQDYSHAVTDPSLISIIPEHREAVEQAVRAGLPVPPEVLADYPAPMSNVDIPAAGDIAAGGGGGLGIAAQLPTARAAFGAAAGGTAGGVAGLTAPAEDEDERFRNAALGVFGGTLAGAVGGEHAPGIARVVKQSGPQLKQVFNKQLPEGMLLLDEDILSDVVTTVQRARDNAGTTTGVRGLREAWKALAAQWSRQIVDTPKQLPQDALYRATVMEGIARKEFPELSHDYVRGFQKSVSRERATGAVSLDNPYNQLLIATGHPELIGRKTDLVGSEFADATTKMEGHRFGRVGSTIAGAAIGLGAGVKRVNPIVMATGGIRGALDLEWSAAMRHLIGVANDSFREAMGTLGGQRALDEAASPFLDELAARGVDVAALRARGGMFSGPEVAAIAGPQAGKDWHALSEVAIRKSGDRVAYLAGDFRDKLDKDYTGTVTTGDKVLGTVERGIGKAIPFARWQIRSTPVLMEIAARHPRATAVVVGANVAAYEQGKEEKLKNYQYGTIPISDTTPGVGLIARARLGGQKGTTRLDPLGMVFPYGSGAAAGEDLPEDATGYQRATALAGRAGFMPNPVIQSLAYVTGQDYKAPGALSRTAGLEGLADIPPVLLRAYLRSKGNHAAAEAVPDLAIPSGRALLDAGRDLLSPVTGASSPDSDPTIRRYAELVMAETGLPLSDPSNRKYQSRAGDNSEPLWEQAVLQSRLQGAAGNATGMVSPVQTMAQTEEAVAAQRAAAANKGAPLLSNYLIGQLPKSQQAGARLANERKAALNPALATYHNISGKARRDELIRQWKEDNERVKRFSPEIYAARLKAYEESLR